MIGQLKSVRTTVCLVAGALLCPLLGWPLATAAAWSPLTFGETALNLVGFPAILAAVLGAPGFLIGLGLLRSERFRRPGARLCLTCAALVLGTVGGVLLSLPVARQGWARVIKRAEPLIAAIRAHERDHGTAPERLAELVPSRLDVLPTTGLGNGAEFNYRKAEGTNLTFGDRWSVAVPAPQLLLGFDQLFYVPGETYPEHGFGGGIKPVGRWAYVHE